MRLALSPNWQIRVDEPHALVVALYMRDVASLRPGVHPALPQLAPAVTPDPTMDALRESASAEWAAWWRLLLDMTHAAGAPFTDPDFPELAHSPALRHVLRVHFLDAVVYSDARKMEHIELMSDPGRRSPEPALVDDAARRRRRPAHPFNLKIIELPLAGVQGWRLSRDRAIVTRALLADSAAYRSWLQPIIHELA